MAGDRFDHLEGDNELPESVKDAISKMDRFGHLEVGTLRRPPDASAPAGDRVLCTHCGQFNETVRDFCWACYKPFKDSTGPSQPQNAPQKSELVLDGVTYDLNDPAVPQDIRALRERMQNEGQNPPWRDWRATRSSGKMRERPFEWKGAKDNGDGLRDQNVTILRIDGKQYTSADKDLSPEMKEVFLYIDQHGVTPALMEHLRKNGAQAKFRPSTTTKPSDGDIRFWKEARGRGSIPSEISGQPQDMMDLELAVLKFKGQILKTLAPLVVPILAPFVLLVLILFVLFYMGMLKRW